MRSSDRPAGLGLLVAAVLLCGVAWALLTPAWQVPDEDSHFAYVQSLVERGSRPFDDGREAGIAAKATEQDLAEVASGFLDSAQRIESDPEWSPTAEARWRAAQARLPEAAREDGGGASSARGNPPGYYLAATLPYRVGGGGTAIDRLYAMRLLGVGLLALFALSGWLLAGELLGRRRPLQLVAGAVCGLAPMATFVSAAVTPDALLLPLWGLTFWMLARVVRRGGRPRDLVALALLVAAALAVKPVSAALVPGALWALVASRWRRPVRAGPVAAGLVAAGLAGCVAAALAVPGGPRRFAAYLWQFYVPEDAWTNRIVELLPWPLRDVWWEGTIGAFGWLEVRFPAWVYVLVLALAVPVVVLAARRVGQRHASLLVAFALPALALVAGLHLTEEWFLVEQGEPFTQGRYLLPLLPLAGLAVAGALGGLGARARGLALGATLGLLAAGQAAGLAVVAARFYA